MVRPSASVSFTSPAGILRLFSDGTAVTRILLPGQTVSDQTASGQTSPRDVTDDILKMASQELQAWFNGELTEFTVPCRPDTGTTFQRHVWNELCQIPFGTTISYSRLASRIGRPAAVRAVGAAVGRNPLPILVPCHH